MTPLGKVRPHGGPKRNLVPGSCEARSPEHVTCRVYQTVFSQSGRFWSLWRAWALVVETSSANLGSRVQGAQRRHDKHPWPCC